MSVCEKCWSHAYLREMADPSRSQYEHYLVLLKENADDPAHNAPCTCGATYFNDNGDEVYVHNCPVHDHD